MSVRFFADETDIGLARALDRLYGGVVHPGHSSLPEVPRGANDDEWLEVVGRLGLVVVSRDGRIRYRPVEKSLWVRHRIRGFVLTGKGSQSTDGSLAVLGKHWNRISELVDADVPGPWMYSVTDRGLRELELHDRGRRRIIGAQLASAPLDVDAEAVLDASASDVADASR